MRICGTRPAAVLSLGVLVCLCVATVPAAAADERVEMQNESWFETSPTDDPDDGDPLCDLPTECPPLPGTPLSTALPPDTLQVAISGGRDTARTFLAPDRSGLPENAVIRGGTLTIPFLADPASGSVAPETAQLRACVVPGFVSDERGGTSQSQPEFTCETSAEGKLDAKAQSFTFDLSPLAATLTTGGIAIVPAQAAQDAAASWRVAIPAKEHESEQQITAVLQLGAAVVGGPFEPSVLFDPPAEPADTGGTGGADPGFGSFAAPADLGGGDVAGPVTGPLAARAPAAQEPAVAAPPVVAEGTLAAPTTAVATLPSGFSYPAVWLAPIVMAALAALVGRSLTMELEPVRAGASQAAPTAGGQAAGGLFERLRDAVRPPAAPTADV